MSRVSSKAGRATAPSRLFLFASYDKDKIIDDSLLYYLRRLSELGDIIFVMDSDAPSSELDKLSNIPNILYAHAARHGEYDFGSYKRGYAWARDNDRLKNYDWLYLVNDSVYGPLNSLKPLLQELENSGADFVGMTENHDKNVPSHIQSWFLGLSKPIFTGDLFDNFISGVYHQNNKWDIVMKYEVGLSRILVRAGYKMYAKLRNDFDKHVLYNEPMRALNLGVPFVKKLALSNLEEIHYLYPHMDDLYLMDMIQSNAARTNINSRHLIDTQCIKYRKCFRLSLFGCPIITIYKKNKYPEYKVCVFEHIPILKLSF